MCGVFGIFGHPEAGNLTYLGLHALQHRGQEAAGIVSSDGNRLHAEVFEGLVGDVFSAAELKRLPGRSAIGHVRYSTTGANHLKNAQPLTVSYAQGQIAVSHNGNLVNAQELKARLESQGSIFQSTTDTEVIVHLLARAKGRTDLERISSALAQVRGAYSLLFLTEKSMIAARDPHGVRPLVIGKLRDAHVIASETCAFDLIDARFVREVEPGEIVIIDSRGLHSHKPFAEAAPKFCVFEHVYFARPDSVLNGVSIYAAREAMGRQLAIEHPVGADVVIPVPDSGVPAAIGYARQSGIPYGVGLVRSHYVGRTFIEPQESIRHFGVRLKLNAVREVVKGKRVIVVDDSIVRGTTSRKIIKMLRAAGAREAHLRISSPPTRWPCFYGIDTPTRKELIAATHSEAQIARFVTCDSLAYLSQEGMMKAVGAIGGKGYCSACFTGDYPIPIRTDRSRASRHAMPISS